MIKKTLAITLLVISQPALSNNLDFKVIDCFSCSPEKKAYSVETDQSLALNIDSQLDWCLSDNSKRLRLQSTKAKSTCGLRIIRKQLRDNK